jgi:hypothetical protein
MTALCARRRALKTAPVEFSESSTEKDCHCIRNNGEWRCSRRLGLIFPSTSLARTDDLQTRIQHRAYRDAEYTERNSGHKSPRAPQLLLLWGAPSRRLQAPWATRRPVRVTPKFHARPQLTRAKPRTDPKRAYTYYSVGVKRDPPLQFGARRYSSIADLPTKFARSLD